MNGALGTANRHANLAAETDHGDWVDDIHREKLDVLLEEYGLSDVMSEESKQHLNRAWHRLDGWPDSPSGLRRLQVEIHYRHRFERQPCPTCEHGETC